MDLFQSTFIDAQKDLGLIHYHVTFTDSPSPGLYAEIDIEPEDCIATVRYDAALCAGDGASEATAIHEVIHLLLADVMHAAKASSRTEEERCVRRLEAIVVAGLAAMKSSPRQPVPHSTSGSDSP